MLDFTPKGYVPFFDALDRVGSVLVPDWHSDDLEFADCAWDASSLYLNPDIEDFFRDELQRELPLLYGDWWPIISAHFAIGEMATAGNGLKGKDAFNFWGAKAGYVPAIIEFSNKHSLWAEAEILLLTSLARKDVDWLYLCMAGDILYIQNKDYAADDFDSDVFESDPSQATKVLFLECEKKAWADAHHLRDRERSAFYRTKKAVIAFCREAETGTIPAMYRGTKLTVIEPHFWSSGQVSKVMSSGGYPFVDTESGGGVTSENEPVQEIYISEDDLEKWLSCCVVQSVEKAAVSEAKVRRWFAQKQEASMAWTKPINDWIQDAVDAFPGLSFYRAGILCREELKNTNAKWNSPGRKPQPQNKTPK